MPSSRAIVRVFIASPGDLGDERRIAKSAVDEFNSNNADFLGYQVELIGWEDTVSRNGRAQEVINQDLLTCDLFVGMMWKRWGTAPDNTGKYTSGFEEEYTVATESLKAAGRPQMKMFFKNVDRESLQDPGDGLKRVVSFQTKLISDKEIYFEIFADGDDFRRRFTRAITNYVQGLYREDEASRQPSRPTEMPVALAAAPPEAKIDDQQRPEVEFLFRIASDISGGGDEITSLDVARLRTLGSSLRRTGNDEPYVGAHDANLIFYKRNDLKLSYGERRTLLDTGLYYWNSHATPLFYWTKGIYPNLQEYLSVTAAIGSSTSERVGAVEALRMLGLPLVDGTFLKEDAFWTTILGPDTETDIKVAVLAHLRDHGDRSALDHIYAELERSNYGTLAAAIASATGLLSRFDLEAAARFLLDRQFETIDSKIASRALESFPRLTDQELRGGLLHRSKLVRLASFNALRDRHVLTPVEVEGALDDAWARVRYEALLLKQQDGNSYSPDDARKILVKPRPGNSLGITRSPDRDDDGEAALSLFLNSYYRNMKKADLEQLSTTIDISDKIPFFVFCEKYFSENAAKLREQVDSRFEWQFNRYLSDIKTRYGDAGKSLVDQTEKLESYLRKKWTRRALDVLCSKAQPEDVRRIRRNLTDDYAAGSLHDIEFLQRAGTFEDIPLVIKTATSREGISLWASDDSRLVAGAVAILHLAKGRTNELVSSDIPDGILKWIVANLSKADLSTLSDDGLISLLMKKDADARKITSLRIIQHLSVSRCRALLGKYEAQSGMRYYNVISILDLSQSFPSAIAKAAAARALSEL